MVRLRTLFCASLVLVCTHALGDRKFKASLDLVYSKGIIAIYIDTFMDKVVQRNPLLSHTYSKEGVFAMFGVDEAAARAKRNEISAEKVTYRQQEVKCEADVCVVEQNGGTRVGNLEYS